MSNPSGGTTREKVDDRILTLIENGANLHHRSMFIIIGDKALDQVVNLHNLLTRSALKLCPRVLWCYKKKLELSSHKEKRAKQIKRLKRHGILEDKRADRYLLFLESGNVTHCLYRDSERLLGSTFGMCILQDFEALTPNILARTIETVEGGGLIILLLRSLQSLVSLCTMVMDCHKRFRPESHSSSTPRFNERFLLSIASCKACVAVDDKLKILGISSHIRSVQRVTVTRDASGMSEKERELKDLKERFHEVSPVGPLVEKCCTMDQGKAVIMLVDAILDKAFLSTVALIGSRGRGKSAALGLAIAGAIAAGYSNIYVTAPSPENLKTLFEFVCKGLNALKYVERIEYEVVKSTEPDLKKATVQINVCKQHRQTIQYVKPNDHGKISRVDLLAIEEAAAIPLPIVKSMLGPYLVFLSSTVNGYEGTGRSLSLKLLQQLQSQSQLPNHSGDDNCPGRLFKKVKLNESIRYASGDPIESWLHGLLCLDVASYIPNIGSLPDPSKCDLYYVNRDTLFSYHKEYEMFLQRMMAIYVASHYKNSPDDLQLMADAPFHHLFVLLGPGEKSENQLPDILCVIQVCLEGQISRKCAMKSLREGHQPFGDQIPWKFCEQFQDDIFPTLSGARIVRIAVHPNALKRGYGSASVKMLIRYYEGELAPFGDADVEELEEPKVKVTEAAEMVSLSEQTLKSKVDLPPLLLHLSERRPEKLHWLGASFELARELFRFWRKLDFSPFYTGHVPSSVTGEHPCMVLRPLNNDGIESGEVSGGGFLAPFFEDFRQRFNRLWGSTYRALNNKLAMSVSSSMTSFVEHESMLAATIGASNPIGDELSAYDMKRLEAYTNNLVAYDVILDLVPALARQYSQGRLPVTLSTDQAFVLSCIGIQHRDIAYIKEEMKQEREQILSLFFKVMKKFYHCLYNIKAAEIDSTLPRLKEVAMTPHSLSLDEDLNEASREVMEKMKAGNERILNPEFLQQFAIVDNEGNFEKALRNGAGKVSASGILSVKSNCPKTGWHGTSKEQGKSRRGRSGGDSSKSNKKKKP